MLILAYAGISISRFNIKIMQLSLEILIQQKKKIANTITLDSVIVFAKNLFYLLY